MAWKRISFADIATGLPLPGLTVTPTVYKRDASAVLSGFSSVDDLGGGAYGITVDDALVNEGVFILFEAAGAFPRYQLATMAADGLFGFLVTSPDGSLYTGAGTPVVGLYVGSDEIARTPPVLTDLADVITPGQHWLWSGVATAGDREIGVAVRFDLPGDAMPAYFEGQISAGGGGITSGTEPVVTVISPTVGATVGKSDPWIVDVTDESGLLRSVVLLAKFPDAAIWEVIYDGTAFGPLYPAGRNERTSIALGFRFTMLRRGGWPPGGPATLRAIAIDTTGDEA